MSGNNELLLSCPFCGGHASHVWIFERKSCFVKCDDCEVLMSRQTVAEVTKAWNRRMK